MMQKVFHYCVALTALATMAFGYDAGAKHYLKPPVVAKVQPAPPEPVKLDGTFSDLFPDHAWQRGVCKRLQTPDGVLLFKQWKQIEGDQWKLWPVTLVVGRGMAEKQDRDPIILNAEQGAEIRFTESLDVLSGGAPPIQRGRMMGLVEIRRPSSDPKSRPVLIRTTNVGIDSSKVWTTEPIHMRVGEATMIGRDLTLHLATPTGRAGQASGTASVLDRMELIYLDKLEIPLVEGPLWESQVESSPQGTPFSPKYPAKLAIQCGGSVEYDFAIDQLSLRESVALIHSVPGRPDDRFDCDSLELQLKDPSNRSINRGGPTDWLDRIVANGSPAIVNLPSFDCRIAAERIDFDAVGGLLRADGRGGVEIKRGPFHALLSQFAYQYNPQMPDAMGTIDAFGVGQISVDDPEIPVRRITWRDQFRVQPLGTATVDSINTDLGMWIDGEIVANFVDGGEFKANAMEGWLKPYLQAARVPNKKPKQTFRPHAFQATGNVIIDSSAASVSTQQLTLHFVDEAEPVPAMIEDSDTVPVKNPLRQWVQQPGANSKTVSPVAKQRPVVKGNRVAAVLRINAQGVSAKDLSVHDDVELIHTLNAGGQFLPAKLTGTKLRLVDDAGTDVIQLDSGPNKPSRFDLGDGFFVGPQISIWPSSNLVRIQGAGEFRMPTAVLPSALSGDDNEQIQWTRAPHCVWKGEMAFDGRTAILTDGVDITAALVNRGSPWALHMTGDRLEVVLLDDVQMRDAKSMRSAAIQQVTLLQSPTQPVIVRAERRGVDGALETRHVLHAPKLTLLPSGGGKLVGAGPGWYRSWMYAESKGPFSSRDKDSDDPQKESTLMGLHLVYHAALKGDLANQTLDFLRGVRVGVRPVSDWQEVVDAEQMDSISRGDSTVDCDTLHVEVTPGLRNQPKIPGLKMPWEMQARGGVVFRTRSENGLLEGTASRAAYSSHKDLFMIEGAPNRGAVIRQVKANGQPGPEAVVTEATIRPRTLEVISSKVIGFSVGTLPSQDKR